MPRTPLAERPPRPPPRPAPGRSGRRTETAGQSGRRRHHPCAPPATAPTPPTAPSAARRGRGAGRQGPAGDVVVGPAGARCPCPGRRCRSRRPGRCRRRRDRCAATGGSSSPPPPGPAGLVGCRPGRGCRGALTDVVGTWAHGGGLPLLTGAAATARAGLVGGLTVDALEDLGLLGVVVLQVRDGVGRRRSRWRCSRATRCHAGVVLDCLTSSAWLRGPGENVGAVGLAPGSACRAAQPVARCGAGRGVGEGVGALLHLVGLVVHGRRLWLKASRAVAAVAPLRDLTVAVGLGGLHALALASELLGDLTQELLAQWSTAAPPS